MGFGDGTHSNYHKSREQKLSADCLIFTERIKAANKIFENAEHPPADMALASDLQCANYYRNMLCLIHRVLNPTNDNKPTEGSP